MSRKTHHVVHHPEGGWNLVKGGGKKVIKHFDLKQDAVDHGRQVSIHQKSEFLIHGLNGRIQNSDSHGHDPLPPKDKR
jgi:hypothetical protein